MADARAQEGRFEVTRGETRLVDDQWLLDGRVDLDLSEEAIDALESGVMLTIQMQFELINRRRFWTDEQVASNTIDFELQYIALTQRYLVRNQSTGEQQSYATLFSALRNLGRIRDWVVMPNSGLDNDETYVVALRAVLNQERLPGPLQMLAFWRGDFSLESNWYRWILN